MKWEELTHPDDWETELPLFNQLVAGEIEHYTLDKRLFRKDGNIGYGTVHVRAVRQEDGSVDHIIGMTEDITERKQAQEAMERDAERSNTCSVPATTNGGSSPTISTTTWPNILPVPSCSSMSTAT